MINLIKKFGVWSIELELRARLYKSVEFFNDELLIDLRAAEANPCGCLISFTTEGTIIPAGFYSPQSSQSYTEQTIIIYFPSVNELTIGRFIFYIS
ncbi:MAG: hypothetical protein BWY22_02380 [Bacteroidetes bacterium ADurb.Bin217]|nr:MAG: hypothetical protein BWY22_02380 [Bacteroidetes bacterium ADurb.Bin217]